jgi:hypothetical protein
MQASCMLRKRGTGQSLVVGLCFFSCCAVSPAGATITGGEVTGGSARKNGGIFTKLTVPFSESTPANTVGSNTFQNFNLYGFDEGQNIELSEDLNVDIIGDGEGRSLGKGMLPKGLIVASHYIFFDPKHGSQTGTVTFDSPVVAIITRSQSLDASDYLINTGVDYLNPGQRGIEGRDRVGIINNDTIEISWAAGSPGDYIRVLTLFSPAALEPVNRGVNLPPMYSPDRLYASRTYSAFSAREHSD